MAGDMVKRVAEAIHLAMPGRQDSKLKLTPIAILLARAALEAMREPTNVMLHASNLQIPTWDSEASRRKWQAMIDAALKESGENDAPTDRK